MGAIYEHVNLNFDSDSPGYWNEEVAQAAEPTISSSSSYVSSNIINDDNKKQLYEKVFKRTNYHDNEKINKLKNDFNNFDKFSIDIGIIDDEDNKTILNFLKKTKS